jgi:hypothetical protein
MHYGHTYGSGPLAPHAGTSHADPLRADLLCAGRQAPFISSLSDLPHL